MDCQLPESVCFSSDDIDDNSSMSTFDFSQDDVDTSLDQNGIRLQFNGGYKKRLDGELPRQQDNKEMFAKLRLRLAKYEGENFKLKSEVCHYRKVNDLLKVESEALITNTTTLIDELARATRRDHQAIAANRQQALPKSNGPIKMLVDANSRLMTENDRLEVINDVLRKSNSSYIDGACKKMEEDKRTIETLRRENEQLTSKLRQAQTYPTPPTPVYLKKFSTKSLDESHRTAETEDLSSSFTSSLARSSATQAQDNRLRSSFLSNDSMLSILNSIPEQECNSDRISTSLQDKERGIAQSFSYYDPARMDDNDEEDNSNYMSSTLRHVDEMPDPFQQNRESTTDAPPTDNCLKGNKTPVNSFRGWFSSQKANLATSMTSKLQHRSSNNLLLVDFGEESSSTTA